MKVTNHLLDGVKFERSPNVGGMMTPTGAIMHYTAGYTDKSAISTLCNPAAKVSAHLVIGRDGTITQLVPFNRVAWHAGPSVLDGINGCNNFCIGFEFVNPGYFRIGDNGQLLTPEKKPVSQDVLNQYDLSVRAANARIGGGTFVWPGYSKAQIDAGLAAFNAIREAYHISHLAGHEEIDTRKWKTDPGPAFPMGLFKTALHGPMQAQQGRSEGAVAAKTATIVPPKLNVRATAAATATVVTVLTTGSEVVVISPVAGGWTKIEYAPGKQGYVSTQYLKGA